MPGNSDQGLIRRIGPFNVDVPRSAGYYGGVALAVGAGLVDPVLGVFIAAIPFVRMLNRDTAPRAARVVGQLLEGMAKPVGGDSEGTVQLSEPQRVPRPVRRAVGARSGSPRRTRPRE